MPPPRSSIVRPVSRDHEAGSVPVRALPLRSMLTRLVAYPSALGSVPDRDKPSIARPTGTPPAHVTPAQAGVAVHGLSLAEAHPVRPAAVQLAAVMALRNVYKDTPALGGGGGGKGGGGLGGGGIGQELPI